ALPRRRVVPFHHPRYCPSWKTSNRYHKRSTPDNQSPAAQQQSPLALRLAGTAAETPLPTEVRGSQFASTFQSCGPGFAERYLLNRPVVILVEFFWMEATDIDCKRDFPHQGSRQTPGASNQF